MSRRSRLLWVGALIAGLLLLAHCGGRHTNPGPGPSPQPQPPLFTSVAPLLAAEGELYSYTIAVADPAGASVNLVLTRGPDGATLSGSMLSWTPSWEQSRKPNAFEVIATNGRGLNSHQAWTVSPSGSVYLNPGTRHWLAADGTDEQQLVAFDRSAVEMGSWSILLPNAANPNNGYLKEIRPVLLPDGRLKYSNVPAGPFYLSSWWTDRSEFNSEEIIGGRRTDPYPYPINATATGAVAGIVWEEGQDTIYTQLEFLVPNVRGSSYTNRGTLDPAATVWNGTFMVPPFSAAKSDIAYVTEVGQTRRTNPVAIKIDQMLAATALDKISVPDNGDVRFSVALSRVTKDRSFRLHLPQAKWADALQQVQTTPGAFVEDVASTVFLTPFLKRTNTPETDCPDGGGPNPCLVSIHAAPGPRAIYGLRDPSNFPAIDLDLGAFYYGNPFPATWGVNFAVNVLSSVEYAVPPNEPVSTMGTIGYVASELPADNDAITPLVTPVTHILLDGKDASAGEVTINTFTPTLSWTPPAGGLRNSVYRIDSYVLIHDEYCLNGPPTKSWCWFLDGGAGAVTDQTSITLTPATARLFSTGGWTDGRWKIYGAVLRVRVIAEAETDLQSDNPVYRTGWADAFTQLIYFRP